MRLRQWIFLALHESRGSAGRLAFFVLCLSVGVAAVVAVAGLSQALDGGIQAQARELLAADLEVSSRRPIPDEVISAIDGLDGARRSGVVGDGSGQINGVPSRRQVRAGRPQGAGERPPRPQPALNRDDTCDPQNAC